MATDILSLECSRCSQCGYVTQAVKKVCPNCGSAKIDRVQLEGRGEVLDFTTVYYPPDNYKDLTPYTSILVKLNNGCKVFGVIEGEAKGISIGSPVSLARHEVEKGRLIFRPG